jgi:hypothetical protein
MTNKIFNTFNLTRLFCLLLIYSLGNSNRLFGQIENVFKDPEATKALLHDREYEIPNYGTVKFKINRAQTKYWEEAHQKDGSSDEVVEITFDAVIKRLNSKKRDKGDYRADIRLNLDEGDDVCVNPNKYYTMDFSIMREIIYPVKGFPYMFTLFADGDLYYWKFDYKKYSFEEYKSKKLADQNFLDKEMKYSLVKCNYISGKK